MEFSCCGFYKECSMGKGQCYWDNIEPGKKKRCRCYRFNHNKPIETVNIKPFKKSSDVKEEVYRKEEQLSLF